MTEHPPVSADLMEQLSEIALELHSSGDHEHTLQQVTVYALSSVGGDAAGIILVPQNGTVETATSTSQATQRADELQIELDEGPSLDALSDNGNFVIGDTGTDHRWPKWSSEIAGLGFLSMLSVALRTKNRRYGALNVFAHEPDRFSANDLAIATIYARHASIALSTAGHADDLEHAIDARHLIGQSQGILMERFGLGADRAFDVLRRHSQDSNIKLHDVARMLVDSRALPETRR